MNHLNMFATARRTLALLAAAAISLSLAACGNNSGNGSNDAANNTSLDTLKGVTATGDPGSKPDVKFTAPLDGLTNGAYAKLIDGNGDTIKDGERICVQTIVYNATSGDLLSSSWESKPDCSATVTKDGSNAMNEDYYKIFNGAKLNSTYGFGVVDTSSSSSSSSDSSSSSSGVSTGSSYLYIVTPVSASADYTKATGDAVSDVPADLPKVTLDKDGKPSIDMNGYKGSDKLVSQALIKGKGDKVADTATVKVNYTGWLLDGTQFDSSWDRGEATEFSLDSVVKGWKQGLAGQTVGSQVLLVIPPDLGYGDQASGSIPANSTLVFVVDILAAY